MLTLNMGLHTVSMAPAKSTPCQLVHVYSSRVPCWQPTRTSGAAIFTEIVERGSTATEDAAPTPYTRDRTRGKAFTRPDISSSTAWQRQRAPKACSRNRLIGPTAGHYSYPLPL